MGRFTGQWLHATVDLHRKVIILTSILARHILGTGGGQPTHRVACTFAAARYSRSKSFKGRNEEKKMAKTLKELLNENYKSVEPSTKNFVPSGDMPPDVDPTKPPPFPIGGPVGEKPKITQPSEGSGKDKKKK
jgi:hypothetical protein